VGLVSDECNDHAVEVEEEHEQVETKLDERFLRIVSSLSCMRSFSRDRSSAAISMRNLCIGVHTFLCTLSFLKISVASKRCWFSSILSVSVHLPATVSVANLHILLGIPCHQRQVQDKREPVAVNEEEEGQESVYGSFWNDVGVEAVAEVDRIDVITGAKLACACGVDIGDSRCKVLDMRMGV